MDQFEELIYWYKREFRQRTALLAKGEGRIEWIDAGTRVSFSEVCEKADDLGLEMNVVELRTALEDRI
jgi:hypothetical protein